MGGSCSCVVEESVLVSVIIEGGGSVEKSTEDPRRGDRCPGIDSLKMTSLVKKYFPLRSWTRHPTLSSSYPTKIASNRRGPPLVRSSGGMSGKHWHPHTLRCERSGFERFITSNGVCSSGSVEVGSRLRRYTKVRTASPQNDNGSLESARRV